MLGWLALILAALTGLFFVFQNSAIDQHTSYAGITGFGVVLLLIGLYFATHKGRWSGQLQDGRSRARLIVVSSLVLLAAGGVWLIQSGHLPGGSAQSDTAANRQSGSTPSAVSVLIRRNAAGQFVAQGHINGIASQLLFDTGASVVMLKHSDAEQAGIDTTALTYTTPVQTANGTVYAAPARVRSIAVGLLKVEDVEALVAKPGSLNENLLGMSFLRRLASYGLDGEFLTLRQ
ncbi:MAG: TIGR02281 family clan AA aspartic protease [Hyphomicrobium sp.]